MKCNRAQMCFIWCRWKKGVDMSGASANHISCNWAAGHQSPSVFCHRSKERISDQKPDLTKDQKTHVHAVKANFWRPAWYSWSFSSIPVRELSFKQRTRKLPPQFDFIAFPLFLPLPQKVWERHWNRPWNLNFLEKASPLLSSRYWESHPQCHSLAFKRSWPQFFLLRLFDQKKQWSTRAPNKAEIDWISPPWAWETPSKKKTAAF